MSVLGLSFLFSLGIFIGFFFGRMVEWSENQYQRRLEEIRNNKGK